MTEKQLQQAVVDCARLFRWLVYHTWDSRKSQPGFPDLVLVRGKEIMFVELKTQGLVSKDQQRWIHALLDAGCETHVWRENDWISGLIENRLR